MPPPDPAPDPAEGDKPPWFHPLEGTGGTRPAGGGPMHVPSLTAAERAAAMDDLTLWVDRLIDRFAIDARTLPPCWARHNGMVEALAALRDHERASYAEDADPRSAAEWLRAYREAGQLIHEQAALTQCTLHEHRVPPPRTRLPGIAGT